MVVNVLYMYILFSSTEYLDISHMVTDLENSNIHTLGQGPHGGYSESFLIRSQHWQLVFSDPLSRLRKRKLVGSDNEENAGETEPNSKYIASPDMYADRMNALERKGALSAYKVKEANRQQIFRASLSDEKRKSYNQKAALRMRKYRDKQKDKAMNDDPPRIVTRKEKKKDEEEKEMKRLYWRQKQKQSRGLQTEEKKQLRLAKARERYQTKLKKKKPLSTRINIDNEFGNEEVADNADIDYKSADSAKKAVHRCIKKLPLAPKKWLRVVGGILKRASPRKKTLLNSSKLLSSTTTKETKDRHMANEGIVKGVREHLRKTVPRKRKSLVATIVRHAKERANTSVIRQLLNIRWAELVRKSCIEEEAEGRKKRCDALLESEINNVREYYQRPNVSIEIPMKKSVSKKSLSAKAVLTRPLKRVYAEYQKEPGCLKIGLDKFKKLRPKHVLTANKTQLRQCVCEYCTNVDNKLELLNASNTTVKYTDAMHLVNDSMCAKESDEKHHAIKCIERTCPNCGVDLLHEKLTMACKDLKEVTWKRWENSTITVKGKSKTTKELLTKEGNIEDFLEELMAELSFLSKHLFVASWQYQQFNHIKSNLPEGWVIMIADFAENYRTFYQDETQAAHWQYEQITVHPIVAYHRCPVDECEEVVTDSIICLSDDRGHDASAVHTYLTAAIKHVGEIMDIVHLVQFTDGCSAQYKSKQPFMDISFASSDYNFTTERCFFGSRHGKGPCDGLGAVTKQGVSQAVKRREVVVRNAKEMHQYCKEKMEIKGDQSKCNHKSRTFKLIKEIDRNRPLRCPKKAYPGTRQVHSVKGIEPGVIAVRKLSCFCEECIANGLCENSSYVEAWIQHDFCNACSKTNYSKKVKKPTAEQKNANHEAGDGKSKGVTKVDDSKSEENPEMRITRSANEKRNGKTEPIDKRSKCTGTLTDKKVKLTQSDEKSKDEKKCQAKRKNKPKASIREFGDADATLLASDVDTLVPTEVS
ncbi:MAG: hypothetical protein ABW168_22320 [Sedimenticola sp.]